MPPRDIPEKFLVAFSFAGEHRDLVRSIAVAVEERLGSSKVFLDEWFEAYIAGDSADIVLQDIYCNRCDLAVVCVSERYGGKPWTLAEHAAIRERVNRSRASGSDKDRLAVLPIRVGDGDVKGIKKVPECSHARWRELAEEIELNKIDENQPWGDWIRQQYPQIHIDEIAIDAIVRGLKGVPGTISSVLTTYAKTLLRPA
jgi:TIR domain